MTSERGCHRVDMKNAAFVKMRDSVSFCKQILIEYVLRDQQCGREVYIGSEHGPCGISTVTRISLVIEETSADG
jgi:hypothetical protein